MGQGISEVLTYAIGVAISPIAIIAVIVILFSPRARANGIAFLGGWLIALTVVSAVGYALADQSDAATSSSASDTISTGKVVAGVLLLFLALRRWRSRPAPGTEPEMPKLIARVDSLSPVKALGAGAVLGGVNPKNLVLTLGAATGVAQLSISSGDAVGALVVFVVLGSITIAGPVVYYFLAGQRAERELTALKNWLALHNAAVRTVVLLVFGVDLIAKGLGPLST